MFVGQPHPFSENLRIFGQRPGQDRLEKHALFETWVSFSSVAPAYFDEKKGGFQSGRSPET